MAISSPIADMLTKIRNASAAGHEKVEITQSKLKLEISKILKNEGYVKNFKKVKPQGSNHEVIQIQLKYDSKDQGVIHGLKMISTPGRRIYSGYKEMPRVFNGIGIVIVSTSEGIITGKKAAAKKIGGELMCSIW